MEIDRNQTSVQIHKRIFENVLTLGLKHKFKSLDEFEDKWYRDANNQPFVLFPHPSIDEPDEAINGCPYPNVWIRHNPESGELEYGMAFWSVPSVDERFINFSHSKNEIQKTRVVSILKGLPDSWLFRVYKRKRHGQEDIVYENKCNMMGQNEIMKVISDVIDWRTQWKKESTERGNWTTPAINLMRGTSNPIESDQRIKDLFNIFDEIVDMTPSKKIKEESKSAKKELQSKIDNLTKNLEKSQYKSQIQLRLKSLQKELEEI
jgi:hypothetical protein